MNITPTQILRLLMEYSTIMMQFTTLYKKSMEEDKEMESSISLMCRRINWMIDFIEKRDGFTYEDITDDPKELQDYLTVMKTTIAATKAVFGLEDK